MHQPKEPASKSINKALIEARIAAGLSVKQAATQSKTNIRTWRCWETEGKHGRRPQGIAFAWLELYMKANKEKKDGSHP